MHKKKLLISFLDSIKLPVQLQVSVTFHEDSSRQIGFDIQNFWGKFLKVEYLCLLSSEGLCETDNEKKKKTNQ